VTREDFREKAAGKYSLNNRPVDVRSQDIFVDGAMYAYDYLMKNRAEVKPDKYVVPNGTFISPMNDLPQLGKT
jgi:hypothetical protein